VVLWVHPHGEVVRLRPHLGPVDRKLHALTTRIRMLQEKGGWIGVGVARCLSRTCRGYNPNKQASLQAHSNHPATKTTHLSQQPKSAGKSQRLIN
jgi:hypothetical protein